MFDPAEHHVRLAAAVAARRPGGADDQVAYAVAIDVAGAADGGAGPVAVDGAVEGEAVEAAQGAQRQCGREAAAAEHHVSLAAQGDQRLVGADDQVVEAVAVDVAGAADGEAGPVAVGGAVEGEAVGAAQGAQGQRGREAGSAEHHVRLAAVDAARRPGGADDDVSEAIAVDVPRVTDGAAGLVAVGDAIEGEAVAAVEARQRQHRREQRRHAAGFEHFERGANAGSPLG
jgi:hypothetical protein